MLLCQYLGSSVYVNTKRSSVQESPMTTYMM